MRQVAGNSGSSPRPARLPPLLSAVRQPDMLNLTYRLLLAALIAACLLLFAYLGERWISREGSLARNAGTVVHRTGSDNQSGSSTNLVVPLLPEPESVALPPAVAPTDLPSPATSAAPGSSNQSTLEDLKTPTPIARTAGVHQIIGVPFSKQERNLNCEFTSAADLAQFYGLNLSWQTVFLAVGHDPNGNPNVGFVGTSFDDPPRQLYPRGYGVYAQPVAAGLQRLGLHVRAFNGQGAAWLRRQIQADHPVIVWAPFDMEPVELTGWYTDDGRTWVNAVRGEHTFTVFGYDEQGVYVHDPWYGQARHFAWPVFEKAWGYLGQMAVSYDTKVNQ